MSNFWKTLSKPILAFAPMEDVTDFVFREIVATRLPRPDVFFTEFTSVEALYPPSQNTPDVSPEMFAKSFLLRRDFAPDEAVGEDTPGVLRPAQDGERSRTISPRDLHSKGRQRIIRKLKYSENQRPIVVQLWGLVPKAFEESARLVAELGFDGIDLNMGCPDRSIARRGACAGLIKNPTLAAEIIHSVRKGAPQLPISVKTRIGFNQIVTDEWITHLLTQKIDALTIHGRIATQMSRGDTNWEEIGKAVRIRNLISLDTIILGNGDIKNYSQVLERQEKYGIDGVMIGRGIFSDPWVFKKSVSPKTHSKEEYLSVLLEHLKLYDATWGRSRSFAPMKKFIKMYIKDFRGADTLRQNLMKTKNCAEALTLLA